MNARATTRPAELAPDGVRLVSAAVARAARARQAEVGTEHLLEALLDPTSQRLAVTSAFATTTRDTGALQGTVRGLRGSWLSADGESTDTEQATEDALTVSPAWREAQWRYLRSRRGRRGGRAGHDLPMCSGALRRVLRLAMDLSRPGDGHGAGPTQLALALLDDPDNRATEALLSCRGNSIDSVRATLKAQGGDAPGDGAEPAGVELLRDCGLLGGPGRPRVRVVAGWLSRGAGLGSPVLFAVEREAQRQAVRSGRAQVEPVDLALAVMALEAQIATTGQPLPPALADASTTSETLRRHGVRPRELARLATLHPPTPVTATVASSPEVARAVHGARLTAVRWGEGQGPDVGGGNRWGSEQVGTVHLMAHLLADVPEVGRLFATAGVAPGKVVAALRTHLGR